MDANSEHLLARHGLRSCADLAVLRPRCVTSSCRNAAAQAQLYGVESPTQNLTIKAPRLRMSRQQGLRKIVQKVGLQTMGLEGVGIDSIWFSSINAAASYQTLAWLMASL